MGVVLGTTILLVVILELVLTVTTHQYHNMTAGDQLMTFKKRTVKPIDVMTTSNGAPVEYHDAIEAINSDLIFNKFFMESMTHLNRERIPERVVHAKGAGAFGYFEVTHDVTEICNAKLFSAVGKKTPTVVRFSPVFQSQGGSDTTRETRGFAVKFYTEDGNLDILGLNIEMFLMKDPLFFPSFVHAFRRNPKTHLMDLNMIWDFLTLRPETLHTFLLLFGDRGIPDGYRYLPAFGIHPFQVVNNHGVKRFVKFHILPDAGIRTLTSEEARRIGSKDPDYATRDLYNAIANCNFPTWTLSIQVVTLEDIKNAAFDLFDMTKRWPLNDYPLRPIGRLILNKNPDNHFAEIEQLAFHPSNLVPGILGGVDKLFEARILSYRDALLYRLGANHNKIKVNCPLLTNAFTYNRDGYPPVEDNEKDIPNYYPNSFNGPVPYLDEKRPALLKIYTDPNANNFDQANELYSKEMTRDEQSRLVANIVSSLNGTVLLLQERAVKLYTIIHPELGKRIAQGLWSNTTNCC